MFVDTLNRASRVAIVTPRGPIPQSLIGLALLIVGWIVMAAALRIVDSEMLSFSGFIMGFCLLIGGLGTMFWAER